MAGVVFQVPSVNAERGLDGDAPLADEDEVGLPDAVVLGDGERAQGPVEGPAGAGEQLLVRQGLEVHDPDPGHLVHRNQGALEGVVERLVLGVGDGQVADQLQPLAEVSVPELVAAGEGFDGSLVDDEALLKRCFGTSYQVPPP